VKARASCLGRDWSLRSSRTADQRLVHFLVRRLNYSAVTVRQLRISVSASLCWRVLDPEFPFIITRLRNSSTFCAAQACSATIAGTSIVFPQERQSIVRLGKREHTSTRIRAISQWPFCLFFRPREERTLDAPWSREGHPETSGHAALFSSEEWVAESGRACL